MYLGQLNLPLNVIGIVNGDLGCDAGSVISKEVCHISRVDGTQDHLYGLRFADLDVSAEDVVVNIVDPGYVKGTESVSKMPKVTAMMAKGFAAVTGRTVEVGASTYVDAVAVKGKESHCCFLTSWRVHP